MQPVFVLLCDPLHPFRLATRPSLFGVGFAMRWHSPVHEAAREMNDILTSEWGLASIDAYEAVAKVRLLFLDCISVDGGWSRIPRLLMGPHCVCVSVACQADAKVAINAPIARKRTEQSEAVAKAQLEGMRELHAAQAGQVRRELEAQRELKVSQCHATSPLANLVPGLRGLGCDFCVWLLPYPPPPVEPRLLCACFFASDRRRVGSLGV